MIDLIEKLKKGEIKDNLLEWKLHVVNKKMD